MDAIFIDDMRIPMIIGIYPHEKNSPQMVSLSLLIGTSTTVAAASDDVADTIDYAEIERRLRSDLQSRQFNLIETLAEHVASLLINEFRTQWVRVSVEKTGVLPEVKRVGVVIERPCVEETLAVHRVNKLRYFRISFAIEGETGSPSERGANSRDATQPKEARSRNAKAQRPKAKKREG